MNFYKTIGISIDEIRILPYSFLIVSFFFTGISPYNFANCIAATKRTSFTSPISVVRNEVFPRIGLSFPRNISAWMYTRLTLAKFGIRYRIRADIYTGLIESIEFEPKS